LAAPAVPELIAALADKSPTVQVEALIALGRIGPAGRTAVPSLVSVLKGDDSRKYERAIEALGRSARCGRGRPSANRFPQGDDPDRAIAAGLALARILSPDDDALRDNVPVLVVALKGKQASVRGDAIRALGASVRWPSRRSLNSSKGKPTILTRHGTLK